MKDKLNMVIGLGGCVAGLIGIGYAMGSRKKLNDICTKLDKSIDDIANNVDVDLPESIIDRAVQKAVDHEVEWQVKYSTKEAVNSVKQDIKKEVQSAVKSQYTDIKKSVSDKVAEEVSKINMRDLTEAVRERAEQLVVDKFDGNLDDILSKFNHNLDNVSKIYGSMADRMSRSNEKEMTFKIS